MLTLVDISAFGWQHEEMRGEDGGKGEEHRKEEAEQVVKILIKSSFCFRKEGKERDSKVQL